VTGAVDTRVLDCLPRRFAEWRAGDDGRVVLERPRPVTTGLRGAWDRLRWLMATPRIRLDDLGSEIWQRIDGEASLAEIAHAIAEAFPDRAEEMDQRLTVFAVALERQGLIELRLPAELEGCADLMR
jgi:hypothetical protein